MVYPTPYTALLDREALKVEKYSRLVMVARKQHADKKRFSLPTFIPFAVSDIGELSPAASDLQECGTISTQMRQGEVSC